MRILVMGGDGYLGWPTAMSLASKGHEVMVVDNYLKRRLADETDSGPLFPCPDLEERARIFQAATDLPISVRIADCADFSQLSPIFQDFGPEVAVHFAEQPAAPYGMKSFDEASLTLNNNLNTTLNLVWAILEFCPQCRVVKIGTMGEYGTPNIDIEEGWLDVSHKGREQTFLYPRQGGSLYHTTKVLDTDLLWFYVRTYGLSVTDLMQGPVYGLDTPETDVDARLAPHFHYDDIFGTVLNRFLVQAVSGLPLTVYGEGNQRRGFLDIRDTLQCIDLAIDNPTGEGELRILNQFVDVLSINDLADRVKRVGDGMGLGVQVERIPNPRRELEDHYYNPANTGLMELGLNPHPLSDAGVAGMLERILGHKDQVKTDRVLPRVSWRR